MGFQGADDTMINDFVLRASMTAEWSHIESLRTSVERHLCAFRVDESFASSVAMVSAELLENAVKYADLSAAAGHKAPIIEFLLHGNRSSIVLTVRNPVADGDSNVELLVKKLQRIGELGDPAEAYAECMRDVYDGKVGEGGLGLVRIVHKAGCTLGYEPAGDGHVKIRATFSVPEREYERSAQVARLSA